MSNTYKPLALVEVDRVLQANTARVYNQAVRLAPRLGGLAVLLDKDGTHFKLDEQGLGGSHVAVTSRSEYYSQFLISGWASRRMPDIIRFFMSRGVNVSGATIAEALVAHEIGHADEFVAYLDESAGDNTTAYKAITKERARQLGTLPLGMATSYAQKSWDENIDNYQQDMRSQGHNDESWRQLVEANLVAYAQLQQERTADAFALRVLAEIYG